MLVKMGTAKLKEQLEAIRLVVSNVFGRISLSSVSESARTYNQHDRKAAK